jgi:subtilisin family serine protease
VTDLSAADRRDAERDPSVLALARTMPTKLIAPVTVAGIGAGAAAAGPTWGVQRVGAADSPFTGAGIKVAVLDTGIDAAHPAFQGINFTTNDFSGDGIADVNGHGTHCAGTIMGRDIGGMRIGIARGVTEALIGKVLGNDGSGSSEMLFDGIKWVSGLNAKVISMSLGFDFPGLAKRLSEDQGMPVDLATSVALEGYRMNLRVFDQLMGLITAMIDFNGGAVVVAASGNESRRDENPEFEVSASVPAAAMGVVSVGALQQDPAGLKIARFSNTNPVVSAPGVDIVSAKVGGGLKSLNGTSMACPHVAGVTALWWDALKTAGVPLTSQVVISRMTTAALTDVFAPGTDMTDRGQGLIQAPSAAVA